MTSPITCSPSPRLTVRRTRLIPCGTTRRLPTGALTTCSTARARKPVTSTTHKKDLRTQPLRNQMKKSSNSISSNSYVTPTYQSTTEPQRLESLFRLERRIVRGCVVLLLAAIALGNVGCSKLKNENNTAN